MEDFYRQNKERIMKEQITSSSFGRWKWVYVADYLTGADQNIPDCPVKIILLEKIETVIMLGIKSWFNDVGLAQVTYLGFETLSAKSTLYTFSDKILQLT